MKFKSNFFSQGLILALILFSLSCKSDGQKYVSSEKIEINYWGEVQDEAWLKIDDMIIYHLVNDTTSGCTGEDYDFFALNNPDELADTIFLPSKSIYLCLGPKWTTLDQSNGVMATNLLIAINNGASKLNTSGFAMENTYAYEGNTYLVTQGKITIKRVDGKKIKISTSEGYGATISALKE
jgi:hypothetical protein